MRTSALFFCVVLSSVSCDDRANSEAGVVPASAHDETGAAAASAGEQTAAPPPVSSAQSPAPQPETDPTGASTSAPHPSGNGHETGHAMPAGADTDEHGMPHDFSDAEHWAEVFDDPSRDEWQRPTEVIRLMGLAPGMTVVDLGAGTGYFVPHLSEAVGPEGVVHALDVEDNLVAYMQERVANESLTNVVPRLIPYDDPQLGAGSIDRVLIVNTWHHIGEREAYSAKLFAALRPGGAVYVVDYTRQSERGPPVEHRLLPEAVIAELEAGGLVGEVVEEPLEQQYIVVGRRP